MATMKKIDEIFGSQELGTGAPLRTFAEADKAVKKGGRRPTLGNGKTTGVATYLPPEEYEILENFCNKRMISKSALLRKLVMDYIKQVEAAENQGK